MTKNDFRVTFIFKIIIRICKKKKKEKRKVEFCGKTSNFLLKNFYVFFI